MSGSGRLTQLRNHHHDKVKEGFEESFKALNIGYIDLYVSTLEMQ